MTSSESFSFDWLVFVWFVSFLTGDIILYGEARGTLRISLCSFMCDFSAERLEKISWQTWHWCICGRPAMGLPSDDVWKDSSLKWFSNPWWLPYSEAMSLKSVGLVCFWARAFINRWWWLVPKDCVGLKSGWDKAVGEYRSPGNEDREERSVS